MAETFFATLKKELIYRSSWPTRRELTGEIFEYIEAFYNPPAATPPSGISRRWSSRRDLDAPRSPR